MPMRVRNLPISLPVRPVEVSAKTSQILSNTPNSNGVPLALEELNAGDERVRDRLVVEAA